MRWLRLLIACLLLSGCARKTEPALVATHFFETVARGNFAEAYQQSAFGFQAQLELKDFERTARALGLTEFVGATWEPAEITRPLATIRGELAFKTGEKLKAVVSLNWEAGQWRLFSIRSAPDAENVSNDLFGLVGKSAGMNPMKDWGLPNNEQLRQLVLKSLLKFNEAIQKKSFEAFYADISEVWRRQVSVGELTLAFQNPIANGMEISAIQARPMRFTEPPFVTPTGVLMVAGSYPTVPLRVLFRLKYLQEHNEWKLLGIEVNLRE